MLQMKERAAHYVLHQLNHHINDVYLADPNAEKMGKKKQIIITTSEMRHVFSILNVTKMNIV